MNRKLAALMLPLAFVLGAHGVATAKVAAERAERIGLETVVVSWSDKAPVDVYVSDRPNATVTKARLVAHADRDGRFEASAAPTARPYFLLRDTRDGTVVRVAERVVTLEQGSNFRDVGGYPAAGGKHVRWGWIFRSAGTPMLTDADVAKVQALGLKDLIDLRSSEERSIAPTRLDGIRYAAIGYSMASLAGPGGPGLGDESIHAAYRRFPVMLAPQMRVLFRTLLTHQGPLAYNCSAGQDRTGFATAMVLSALGVRREVILADYHLSTTYRRPEWEMPRIDRARQSENAATAFFAKVQQDPRSRTPQPLFDSEHRALLAFSFDEIERRWGSVDGYLHQELGLTAADIAKLRAEYLE